MAFGGFDPGALALLDELPAWSAEDYAAHRARLAEGLTGPGGELIAAVAERLPVALTVVPRSSVSPLNRDLRFVEPGTPRYKDHLMLTTWQGQDKHRSPTLWIRLDARRAGFASGIPFTPAIRARWRDAIGGRQGEELARDLDVLVADRRAEVAGEQVKRVPAPFTADHPRAELLRRTSFQVRYLEPLPATVGEASFADWCTERLEALLPVHGWLARELT